MLQISFSFTSQVNSDEIFKLTIIFNIYSVGFTLFLKIVLKLKEKELISSRNAIHYNLFKTLLLVSKAKTV